MKSAEAFVTKSVNRPAKDVWAVLSDFGNLSWAMGMGLSDYRSEGTGLGMIRIPTLANGQELREELIEFDEDEMRIAYAIIGGNFIGAENYKARVQIKPSETGCEVSWHCTADFPDDGAAQGQAALDMMANGMGEVFITQFRD